MKIPDKLSGNEWHFGAYVLLALAWSLGTAPWRRLANLQQLNVWLGTIVSLTLMWRLDASIRPGLSMHLLGATLFTLMFGRQLAIAGLSVVLAAVTLNSATGGVVGW